ncbi:hypothetical protein [Sinorhizobium alkalisoli]|uniref:hypothetical protein n=1 Tax=Sinorhizobium alkalisoli TaxID=1752398 RepID=UPI0012A88E0C|nr:hypothetical protein [Sinorhizobium alkalisoli]QFI70209.1 hypothetical protein EKH55_5335 [Sinorhizobium alkalisoli]
MTETLPGKDATCWSGDAGRANFVVDEYHYGDIPQWKSMNIITDPRITGTITTMDM